MPRPTSAAVNTWVPGRARAADTSTSTMRAWAYGERTNVDVERIRQVDVLDVEALAPQEARILAPENPLAHDTTHPQSLPQSTPSRWRR